MSIYLKLKDLVFTGMKPYSAEPLERLLKKHLGENATMSAIARPKMIITTALAAHKPHLLKLMRNFESAFDILGANEGDGPVGMI